MVRRASLLGLVAWLSLLGGAAAHKSHHTARPYSTRDKHYAAVYPTSTAVDTNMAIPIPTGPVALPTGMLSYSEFEAPLDLQSLPDLSERHVVGELQGSDR